MLINLFPTNTYLLFTWLFHLIMAFNFKNWSKRIHASYEGLWKILAYVGLMLIVIGLLYIGELLFYGYLFELMAFSAKYLGPWSVLELGLDVFAPLVFCLNFWSRYRNNKSFRNFQLLLIIAIFSARLALGDFTFNIGLVPGWYSTLDFFSFPFTFLIASVLIWLLNYWILKKESRRLIPPVE